MKHYYVAVGTEQAKLVTLTDLLRALLPSASASPLGVVVCCGSRASLDEVCDALRGALGAPSACLWTLHSDMSVPEARAAAAEFRAAAAGGGGPAEPAAPPPPGRGAEPGRGAPPAAAPLLALLASTDPPLRALGDGAGDAPLPPADAPPPPGRTLLLVNFDLPPTRDAYARRVAAALGGGGRGARMCIHFLVAPRHAEDLRLAEGYAAAPVHEMPVHVADIFE